MRPLPDLTDLAESPSVFSQPTDDWNGIFASEFAGMGSEQAGADQQQAITNAGMDPISQGIDGLSSALTLAGDVLDLLSGDLDLVNLDPEIINFQQADSLLDSNLSNFTLDYNTIAGGLFSDIYNVASEVVQFAVDSVKEAISLIFEIINSMQNYITYLMGAVPGG